MNILEIGVGLVKKKIEQNLYYIYKIPSNKIRNLERYSFKEARENGEFISKQDIKKRAKVGDAVIALLEKFGCIEGMSETNQMSLFDAMF